MLRCLAPISCSHQKAKGRRDGGELSFVELPEFTSSACSFSASRLLLCCLVRKYRCQRAAAVLSVKHLTCGLLRAADDGHAGVKGYNAGMPSPRAATICQMRSSARVPVGHLRCRASTNESLSFICMPCNKRTSKASSMHVKVSGMGKHYFISHIAEVMSGSGHR